MYKTKIKSDMQRFFNIVFKFFKLLKSIEDMRYQNQKEKKERIES